MIDFSLTGKTALITGASRGIGAAIARGLAEQGAHCILVSRKKAALEAVAEAIGKTGGQAEAMACHMGDPEAIKTLFATIQKRFEKLDILVNNAATNPYFGEMIDADEGVWDKTVEVNLKGPFLMIQNAAPVMKQSNGGAIVNVSSINAVRPGYLQGIYSITKAALITMTQAFARELAPHGIRVNALLPGLTDTKFAKALMDNPAIYKTAVAQIPMGRHAEPEEMVGAVLYLVSDAASYTTGSAITCDGGFLA
jgi:NAD(P)-dependent dehydrogenase (short-subunit alcohol dehydrogenase family)